MFISSSGRKARTKLAEILVRTGYNMPKCLRVVSYPAPKTIRLFARGQDIAVGHLGGTVNEHVAIGRTIKCYYQFEDQHRYFRTGETVVETAVINDGDGEWFLTASRLDVQFSDNTNRALAFGHHQSGSGEKSPKVPAVHLARLPFPTGWPVPGFLIHPDTAVNLDDSFYSAAGY